MRNVLSLFVRVSRRVMRNWRISRVFLDSFWPTCLQRGKPGSSTRTRQAAQTRTDSQASQAIQKKFSLQELWNTLQSIYTSSCFISFNGFAFIFIFCSLRKIMGKFYYLHCSYLPAFAASFLAILIERKSRRAPLALYVTNVASETLFRMAIARGKLRPMPNGEVYLFSATMALFLYIIRKHGFSKDFISFGLRHLIGKYEAKQNSQTSDEPETDGKPMNPGVPNMKAKAPEYTMLAFHGASEHTLLGRLLTSVRNLWDSIKHKSCRHPQGCMQYAIQGFLRPFLAGYAVYAAISFMSSWKKLLSNPGAIIKIFTSHRVINLGVFLGGFSGTYRAVNCLCRWMFGHDREIYALPAAFLGGLFMRFFPNSTLALYLTWKLIEVGYILGMKQGILPRVRGSMLVLYACSAAVLFYAAVLEPHNLRPGYLKFLNRITRDRIGAINRHVLDIFGTHASKLYSSFWPELDLKYCSRVFQESVLLWLIH